MHDQTVQQCYSWDFGLMRFNLPLSTVIVYIGEDGDDMRMIGHEIRESPERNLATVVERPGEIF